VIEVIEVHPVVIEERQVSVVELVDRQVIFGGEQGPPGPPGTTADKYEHQQLIAAATWVVNHNLGFRPQISALSLGGATMWAEVIHASLTQALVYFDEPRSGLAICS
jgi:hypothetical protein